jgi:hypothetical protein
MQFVQRVNDRYYRCNKFTQAVRRPSSVTLPLAHLVQRLVREYQF